MTIPDWILTASGQAALFALVLLVLRFSVGTRMPSWLFGIGWILVAVRLALPVVPENPWNLIHAIPPSFKTSLRETTLLLGVEYDTASISSGTQPHALGYALNTRAVFSMFWIAGMIALLTRITLELLRVSRLKRQLRPILDTRYQTILNECCVRAGMRKTIEIGTSHVIAAPVLIGWLRPTLVLPESLLQHLTDSDLRCILLHEVVHVRRRDIALNWLLTPLQILHWFNPLVWLSFKCWRADRETACDRETIRLLPSEDQAFYGETLLKILTLCKPQKPFATNTVGLFYSHWELKRRIALLKTQKSPRTWTVMGAVLIAISTSTLLTRAEEPAPRPKTTENTDGVVLVLYDISDLLEGPKDFGPGEPVAFNPVSLIKAYIEKLAAKDAKLKFELQGGKVVLNATPAMQRRADQFISRLRHAGSLQVLSNFKILEAKSAESLQAVLAAHGVHTDKEGIASVDSKTALEVSSDKGMTLISTPRLSTFNNQRAYVEVAQKDTNDALGEFVDGLRISIRNIVSADQRFVSMELSALIKSPTDRSTSKITLTVPDGATTLVRLNAEKKEGKNYALFCSVSVIDEDETIDDEK